MDVDVGAEAKRIMVQALSKMYSSRTQRGGMSLHRSLLLTLVMKAARDTYHSAKLIETSDGQSVSFSTAECQKDEPMDTSSAPDTPRAPQTHQTAPKEDRLVASESKENCSTASHDVRSRKRRGNSCVEPDFLPCKKAKLDAGEVKRVLQDSTARSNNGYCAREADTLSVSHIPRTVATC